MAKTIRIIIASNFHYSAIKMTHYDFTHRKTESSRHWMGVVYNPMDASKHHGMGGSDNFGELLNSKLEPIIGTDVKYYCYGEELCPTSGTQHLQMYFIFREKQSLAALRKKFTNWLGFNCTIAFSKADNNTEECRKYCLKDNKNTVECGDFPLGKGKRSDLDAVIQTVKSGGNLTSVANLHPAAFIKCGQGIARWICQTSTPRDFKTEVFWIHGSTGTGKSRWVMNSVDREDLYLKSGSTKWWDNYAGQKNVLWDDFRPCKEVPFEFILRLLDRFPMTVEMKGGSVNFAPERIFITTPKNPTDTFAHWEHLGEENLKQLTRRLTHVYEFAEITSFLPPSTPPAFLKVYNVWKSTATTIVEPIIENNKKIKYNESLSIDIDTDDTIDLT